MGDMARTLSDLAAISRTMSRSFVRVAAEASKAAREFARASEGFASVIDGYTDAIYEFYAAISTTAWVRDRRAVLKQAGMSREEAWRKAVTEGAWKSLGLYTWGLPNYMRCAVSFVLFVMAVALWSGI